MPDLPHESSAPTRTFESMDGLRGVAAWMVLAFHLEELSPFALPHGYLAVDFFFGLSGFVIAHAYDRRLAEGMSVGRFLLQRWLRLLPLLLLGSALALAVQAIGAGPELPHSLAKAFAQLFVFHLPQPTDHDVFDLNPPFWSLQYEMLAYALYAMAWSPRRGWLYVLIALGACALGALVLVHGSVNKGVEYPHAWLGVGRALFAFFAGVLLRRVRRPPARRTGLALLLPCALAAVFGVPGHSGALELAVCVALFPLLLWLASSWEPPAAAWRALRVLGALSYTSYVIHFPLLRLLQRFARDHVYGPWLGAGFLVLVPLLSHGLARWYDEPLRRALRGWFERRTLAVPLHTHE